MKTHRPTLSELRDLAAALRESGDTDARVAERTGIADDPPARQYARGRSHGLILAARAIEAVTQGHLPVRGRLPVSLN